MSDYEIWSRLVAPVLKAVDSEFVSEQKLYLAEAKRNRQHFYVEEAVLPPVPSLLAAKYGITEAQWRERFRAEQEQGFPAAKHQRKWMYKRDTRPCGETPIYDQTGRAAYRCAKQERGLLVKVVTLNLAPDSSVLNVEYLQAIVYNMENPSAKDVIPTDVPYAPIVQDLLESLGLSPAKDYQLDVEQFTALPLWLQAAFVYVLFYAAMRLRDGQSVEAVSWRLQQAQCALRTTFPIRDKIVQLKQIFDPKTPQFVNPVWRLSWKETLGKFMRLISYWLMYTEFHLPVSNQVERSAGMGGQLVTVAGPSALAVQNPAPVAVLQTTANAEVALRREQHALQSLSNDNAFQVALKARFEEITKVSLLLLDASDMQVYRQALLDRYQGVIDVPNYMYEESRAVLLSTRRNLDFLHDRILGQVDVEFTVSFLRTVIQSELVRNPLFFVAVLEGRYDEYMDILSRTLNTVQSHVRTALTPEEDAIMFASGGRNAILTQRYWTEQVGFASRNFTSFFSAALVPIDERQADYLYITNVLVQGEQARLNRINILGRLRVHVAAQPRGTNRDDATALINSLEEGASADQSHANLAKLLFEQYWLRKKVLSDARLRDVLKDKVTTTDKTQAAATVLPDIFDDALRAWNDLLGPSRIRLAYDAAQRQALFTRLTADRVWEDSGFLDRILIYSYNFNTRIQWIGRSIFGEYGIGAIYVAFGGTATSLVSQLANVAGWGVAALSGIAFGGRYLLNRIRGR